MSWLSEKVNVMYSVSGLKGAVKSLKHALYIGPKDQAVLGFYKLGQNVCIDLYFPENSEAISVSGETLYEAVQNVKPHLEFVELTDIISGSPIPIAKDQVSIALKSRLSNSVGVNSPEIQHMGISAGFMIRHYLGIKPPTDTKTQTA